MAIVRNALRGNDRLFPLIHIQIEGRRVGAHRLVCSTPGCGAEAEILDQNDRPLPSNVIERKFKQKSWEVGKNERHDVCPRCVEAERVARRQRRRNNIISINQPSQGEQMAQAIEIADAPREMTREDKRIVYGKLSEVYIDETKGYAAPWTDAAVAKDLGVPAKWVSDVRDEMFGPARDNSEIRDILARASKIGQEAASAITEAEKIRTEAASLIVRCNTMNTTLKDLFRAVEVLNTAAGRIERAIAN